MQRNKNNNKSRGGRTRRGRPDVVPVKTYIPRSITTTRESPDSVTVWLGYPSEFVLSTAGTVLTKRFYTNGALGPEVGSAIKPNGYAQWATLYNQYRVIAYKYKFFVSNLETFPIYVYATNSNTDPGTGAQGSLIGRPNTQFAEISGKGGMDRSIISGRYTVSRILGQTVEFDDKYSALGNALPSDVTYLGLGSQSSGGANLTNGTAWFGLLSLQVRFYDRLPL